MSNTVLLFSYGTLQYEQVQLDTFGRLLEGEDDEILGFRLERVEITDEKVLKSSGQQFHPIAFPTDDNSQTVIGKVLHITQAELEESDKYEVDDYLRVTANTKSGKQVQVYIAKPASWLKAT